MSKNSDTLNAQASYAKQIILGLQHLIAMFGATVLVPILTGFNPSVALLSAGFGTLIFHFCTEKKVPVFVGSSFAFIPLILQVKEMYGGDLAYAQGGIIAAGLIYVILSFVVKAIGTEAFTKLLPSQVVGPMIVVIGFNLIPVAVGMAKTQLVLALITLGITVGINLFAKGFLKQLSILIGVSTGYLVALAMGVVDTSLITNAPLLAMPAVQLPKFSFGAIVIIAPVVLAVFMEHIGDVTTNGAVVGKNFIKDPGLHKTLLGDGLATIFAGFIGGPANTTYGENTGVLAITKNYNPAILRLAACFAIGLSIIGKLGGVLSSIPTAVMGGISLVLFTMIALVGLKMIKTSEAAFNWQNILTMSAILFIGLSPTYVPKFAPAIHITSTVALSGLSLAALSGVLLNLVLTKVTFNKKVKANA